jgi:hypothetical protein
VLGCKPRLMLPNASGLTWIDDQYILFSEIKSGIHMAMVTAIEGRAQNATFTFLLRMQAWHTALTFPQITSVY